MLFGLANKPLNNDESKLRYLIPLEIEILEPIGLEHQAVAIDIETTGLDPEKDQITSLSFIRYEFDDDMEEIRPIEIDTYYNEPTCEYPDEIQELTGLTMDDLRGYVLTQEQFDYVFNNTEFSVAHNASFDRKFIDKYYRADMIWLCTIRDVDLKKHYGNNSSSLASILAQAYGVYIKHHISEEDTKGSYLILSNHLKEMVEKSFEKTYSVYAWDSEFFSKDGLKSRGYRWESQSKVWYKTGCNEEESEEELNYAKEMAGCSKPEKFEESMWDRHKQI